MPCSEHLAFARHRVSLFSLLLPCALALVSESKRLVVCGDVAIDSETAVSHLWSRCAVDIDRETGTARMRFDLDRDHDQIPHTLYLIQLVLEACVEAGVSHRVWSKQVLAAQRSAPTARR